MTEEELIREFGDNGWYQLKDEIYNRYRFTPAKIEIEEHHVGVYRSKKDNHFKKADHPAYLLRNSLVSPSLLAGILNAKYVNAVPLYRQEQEFARYGLEISRREMAHWTILCTERYLSLIYDCMHKNYTSIMSCRQMKHRSVLQKKTERRAPNILCGSIGPEKCMRIDRSSYMITSHREIYRIRRSF